MPWNLWIHSHLYCPFLYSKAWKNSFTFLVPMKYAIESFVKTKISQFPLSCQFLLHLLLPFPDKLLETGSHTSCLHSVTSRSLCRPLQLTWNLPAAQKPLMLRSCVTTEYLSVVFLLWSITAFDIFLTSLFACETLHSFHCYSTSVATFSFFAASSKYCYSTGICRKQFLLFPFAADFPVSSLLL